MFLQRHLGIFNIEIESKLKIMGVIYDADIDNLL